MISKTVVEDILSLYKKHGWKLSCVLLSGRFRNSPDFGDVRKLFADCEITDAEFDAAWFERPSRQGRIAIELRHLSDDPYALFELVETEKAAAAGDARRKDMELRMAEYASKSGAGKAG